MIWNAIKEEEKKTMKEIEILINEKWVIFSRPISCPYKDDYTECGNNNNSHCNPDLGDMNCPLWEEK